MNRRPLYARPQHAAINQLCYERAHGPDEKLTYRQVWLSRGIRVGPVRDHVAVCARAGKQARRREQAFEEFGHRRSPFGWAPAKVSAARTRGYSPKRLRRLAGAGAGVLLPSWRFIRQQLVELLHDRGAPLIFVNDGDAHALRALLVGAVEVVEDEVYSA